MPEKVEQLWPHQPRVHQFVVNLPAVTCHLEETGLDSPIPVVFASYPIYGLVDFLNQKVQFAGIEQPFEQNIPIFVISSPMFLCECYQVTLPCQSRVSKRTMP